MKTAVLAATLLLFTALLLAYNATDGIVTVTIISTPTPSPTPQGGQVSTPYPSPSPAASATPTASPAPTETLAPTGAPSQSPTPEAKTAMPPAPAAAAVPSGVSLELEAPSAVTACQNVTARIVVRNNGERTGPLSLSATGLQASFSLERGEEKEYYYWVPGHVDFVSAEVRDGSGAVMASRKAEIRVIDDYTLCVGLPKEVNASLIESLGGSRPEAGIPVMAVVPEAGNLTEIEVTLGEKNVFADILDNAGGYMEETRAYEPGIYSITKRVRDGNLRVVSEITAYQVVYSARNLLISS